MAPMNYNLHMSIFISLLAHFLHVAALSSLPRSRRSVLQNQLLPMAGLMGATTCAPSQIAVAAEMTPPLTGATAIGDAAAVPNGVIWRTVSGQVLPATPSSLVNIMQTEVLGPISVVSSGIVCISERHDDFEHHKVQLKVLMTMKKVLAERSQDVSQKLSIGMEMFQRQHQKYLDQFIAKTDYGIDDLKRDTNWDVTWGYDILHYLPLLFFAKKNSIRVLGLHPPDELVEQVERQGLSSMAPGTCGSCEVDTKDREHAEDFRKLAMQRLSVSTFGCQEAMDAAIRRQYEVQCFREDYMAETAATQMARQPDGWLALLAGEQHILRRNGIPFRALRRSSMRSLSLSPSRGVFTILPRTISFPIAAKDAPGIESADYVWYVQRDPSTEFREDKVNNAPMRNSV